MIPISYTDVWEGPHLVAFPRYLMVVHNAEVSGRVELALYSLDAGTWQQMDCSGLSYGGYQIVQVIGDGVGFYAMGGYKSVPSRGYSDAVQYARLTLPLPREPLRLAISVSGGQTALLVYGPFGTGARIDYATELGTPNLWRPLTSVPLAVSPTRVVDEAATNSNSKFYRALLAP